MSDLFSDRLLDAIAAKGSPICVGIDPVYEMLPDAVGGPSNRRNANDATAAVDAIFAFTIDVLKIVAPLVPVDDAKALGHTILATLLAPPDTNRSRMRAHAFSVTAAAHQYLDALEHA